MKKKFVIPILLITIFLMLACEVALEGISEDAQKRPDPMREIFEQQTLAAMNTEESGSAPAAATPDSDYQPVIPPGSDMERGVAGSHEYSVNASNFDCTCQATDNMTVDFNFTGNQVEITKGGGGATRVFDKIGENTYQRTDMNYYILRSVEGDPTTDTKVDREDKTVIILTGNGYIMENYQGLTGSPCCYYTFTIEK
ncbi:MAG: hypothetical protein MUO77_15495 [Anaerolineales bacterium]|nr:hypothetical protein [Anaerolineales bacterium]